MRGKLEDQKWGMEEPHDELEGTSEGTLNENE